ncbi:MAG TPA: MFS transporter [Thermomicrobiales bacterium]|nr:MFS transporter [Thermomicrobiales bacterium]
MTSRPSSALSRTGLGQEFLKLWTATGLSNLGDGIWLVAAPLLAATLTRNPALIAGLVFAQRIPWLLFPLFSGVLADRLDRRKTMVGATLFRATLVAILAITVLTGTVSLPLLYALFFLITAAETLFDTSSTALVPAIVPRDQLKKANARLAGTISVTNQFVGLPLGGFLFARAAALPFTLGVAGLGAAAGVLSTLRGSFRAGQDDARPARGFRAEIGDGVRWLLHHRLLRTTAITLGVLNLVLVAQVSIMVLYAEERLGLGPAGYGLLLTMSGLGGVIGSLVAERIVTAIGEARYLRLAVLIEAVIPAAIALTGNAFVAGGVLFVFGVHAITWGSVLVSLRQELTPDAMRGRIQSVHGLIENGTAAPGALLGGFLAVQFGLASPFWFSTVVALLLIPVVWPAYTSAEIARARCQAGG